MRLETGCRRRMGAGIDGDRRFGICLQALIRFVGAKHFSPLPPGAGRQVIAMKVSKKGFTVVELLLAIAVMALLFAMVNAVMLGLLDTDKRVNERVLEQRVGSAIVDLISQDLQGLYTRGLKGVFVGRDNGEADELYLLTTRKPAAEAALTSDEDESETAPASGAGSGFSVGDEDQGDSGFGAEDKLTLTKVSYYVEPSEEAEGYLTLLRGEEPYVPEPQGGGDAPSPFDTSGDEPQKGGHVFEVYSKVGEFDIRYLDQDGQWVAEWKDPDALPVAIEVNLAVVPDPRMAAVREEQGRELRNYQLFMGMPVDVSPTADVKVGR